MSRLLHSYMRLLETSPNITKALTAGVLLGLGDSLTQGIEKYNGVTYTGYDWKRTAKMSSFGLFVVGPLLHQWYKLLHRITAKSILPGGVEPSKFSQIYSGMKQVLIDQTVFAGPSLALFFIYMNLIEGKDWTEVYNKMSNVFWDTLIMNWKVWPAVQFINFTFVPLAFRVLVVNAVSILWNAYLSFVQYSK
jgi:protein Mpv17